MRFLQDFLACRTVGLPRTYIHASILGMLNRIDKVQHARQGYPKHPVGYMSSNASAAVSYLERAACSPQF